MKGQRASIQRERERVYMFVYWNTDTHVYKTAYIQLFSVSPSHNHDSNDADDVGKISRDKGLFDREKEQQQQQQQPPLRHRQIENDRKKTNEKLKRPLE